MASSAEIGEDYSKSLTSLTFNSRPIIQNLTIIAQENVHAAEYIAKAIERQIAKAVPSQKLFSFYLLDSVSKNVGSPYNILFGQNLFKIFTEAYVLVNDENRKKFIGLFKTWKSAVTEAGLPLFPEDQIGQIESFLEKATRRNRSAPPQLSVELLIREIDILCQMVQERLNKSPSDTKAQERFKVLMDLKRILTTQKIASQQLQVVHTQLVGIRKDETEKLTLLKAQQTQPQPQQQQPQMQFSGFPFQAGAPLPQSAQNRQPKFQPPLKQRQPAAPSFSTNQLQALLGARTPPPQVPTNPGDVSSILSSLSQSGVFEKLNLKPAPVSAAPKLDQQSLKNLLGLSQMDPTSSIALSGKAVVASEDQILARFDLTQQFLNSHKPSAEEINLIYNIKPNKCSNCAKRFKNTPEGNIKQQEHLDWHFRMNKRLKQNEVKTISNRAYYLDDEKWVNFKDDEILGSLEEVTTESQAAERDGRASAEKRDAKYVVLPADSTDLTTVCQVCKEKINAEFNDDLGEWIWKNCISVKDRDGNERNYHYDCYVETRGVKRERSPG
ncbi:unnamed protein product [Kuraishia capsulata CBS 1993]|uniref:CID domain-containing protein n=1 Tax=Kuraishia capsulata CBS 1993 TaxID=1382522 RepID=W6MQY9_9ASCO|nr:uncharacterized protein KUCA_T00003646001 [Kuraishia capsulata CBS 1993]CDK27667.1 unnamed protein product [Kuraishia capsulata CBS 1993]